MIIHSITILSRSKKERFVIISQLWIENINFCTYSRHTGATLLLFQDFITDAIGLILTIVDYLKRYRNIYFSGTFSTNLSVNWFIWGAVYVIVSIHFASWPFRLILRLRHMSYRWIAHIMIIASNDDYMLIDSYALSIVRNILWLQNLLCNHNDEPTARIGKFVVTHRWSTRQRERVLIKYYPQLCITFPLSLVFHPNRDDYVFRDLPRKF